MNTHGHEEIANQAGIPLLKEAFSKLGYPDIRLEAFYLGNWITDISQIVDPGAISNLSKKLASFVGGLFSTLLNASVRGEGLVPLKFVIGDLQKLLMQGQDDMLRTCVVLEKVFNDKDDKGRSLLFKLVESAALLKGYFKFVHPNKVDEKPRMDLKCYLGVFDNLFIQYYPHHHLDRPQHPAPQSTPTGQTQYDDRKPATPGLYDYLNDDIHAISGMLYDVDLTWAEPYLHSGLPNLDENVDWNVGLARLGKALHGVEDFFAHSNFIELSALMRPQKYLPKPYDPFTRRRFLKRLKRYDAITASEKWTDLATEEYVVTGYFDFVDTFVSLSHLLGATLLGSLEIDNRFDQNAKLQEAGKQLEDFLAEPKLINTDSIAGNDLIKYLKRVTETVPVLENASGAFEAASNLRKDHFPKLLDEHIMDALVAAMPIFAEVKYRDSESVTRLANAAFNFLTIARFGVGTAVTGGKLVWHVLKLVQSLELLLLNPVLWLNNQLRGTATGLIKFDAEIASNTVAYLSKEALYTAIGLERVGCHSLIAKDHGQEVLAKQASKCAMFVHYKAIEAMLRWHRPGFGEQPSDQQWVNWNEFIERYLSHPWSEFTCDQPTSAFVCTMREVQDSERESNWLDFFSALAEVAAPLQGSDIELIRLNFETVVVGLKSMDTPMSRAFNKKPPWGRVGAAQRVVIPRFDYRVLTCKPNAEFEKRWFVAVMRQQDWKAAIAEQIATTVFHSSRSAAQQAHADGVALELRLRAQYNRSY